MLVSSDRVEIAWSPVRGAELYETKAVAGFSVVACNDTAPACTLSALDCDTKYNVTVYSFSEVRGSNLSCSSHFITTGMVLLWHPSLTPPLSLLLCASGWLFSKAYRKGGWGRGVKLLEVLTSPAVDVSPVTSTRRQEACNLLELKIQ